MSSEEVPKWVKARLGRAKANPIKREFRKMLTEGHTAEEIVLRLKEHATMLTNGDAALGRNQLMAIGMIFDRAIGKPHQHVESTRTKINVKRIEFSGAAPVLPPSGAHLKLLEQTDTGWKRVDGETTPEPSGFAVTITGSQSVSVRSTLGSDSGETDTPSCTDLNPDEPDDLDETEE